MAITRFDLRSTIMIKKRSEHRNMIFLARRNYIHDEGDGPRNRVRSVKSYHTEGPPKERPFDICLSERHGLGFYKEESWRSKTGEKQSAMNFSLEKNGQLLRPGMVLLKAYLSLSEQVDIVAKCRALGVGQGGFYRPGYKDGGKLRLHMMCLGLDWDPQTRKYAEFRQTDGSRAHEIPCEFISLVEDILQDSHSLIKRRMNVSNANRILPAMSPDICIVNFYTKNGKLGLHQDRDESEESLFKGLPVVSLSIGDTAEFLYGDQRDVNKADIVLLESGDVLVFGGQSRHVFHGVTNIIPNSAPSQLLDKTKLRPGRLNLTFRKF